MSDLGSSDMWKSTVMASKSICAGAVLFLIFIIIQVERERESEREREREREEEVDYIILLRDFLYVLNIHTERERDKRHLVLAI